MEVRLYDANGQHVGSMDADEEPAKDGLVESGGKTYVWNQRNNQWREASGTASAKFTKVDPQERDGPAAPEVEQGTVMSNTATPEANASARASGKGDK